MLRTAGDIKDGTTIGEDGRPGGEKMREKIKAAIEEGQREEKKDAGTG